jgi:hypothetical protein
MDGNEYVGVRSVEILRIAPLLLKIFIFLCFKNGDLAKFTYQGL